MKRNLFTLLALCAVLSFSGCKEDEPSKIPTVPTTFNIKDGAEVNELSVTLSANGSTVEDENYGVDYVYYIGKSVDALEETSADVKLEPYTQYFWCAQAKTEAGESNMTDVRTFYCVPRARIELARSFGEDENATTIKWAFYKRGKLLDKSYITKDEYEKDPLRYWIESLQLINENDGGYQYYEGSFYEKEKLNIPESKRKQMSITVDISSDDIHDNIKSLELAGVADSVYITSKDVNNNVLYNVTSEQNELLYVAAYKYNFKVNVDIPVGDKVVRKTTSIESVLVNNNAYAVDKEFNIYRAIPIGDDTWTIDNLRLSKSPHQSIFIHNIEGKGVWFSYFTSDRYINYLNECILNGYHVSTGSDWKQLEKHFGIEYGEDVFEYTYDAQLEFEKEDETTYSLSKYFATNVPWEVFSDEKISEGNYLNSFNVHCYGIIDKSLSDAVIFYVHDGRERIISKKYKSLALAADLAVTNSAAIRLVKDKE
ncbi:MAG: hypothetical protein IKR17_08835 [Bacteroidales bacterium]|nr:hypothetical protein [Bacteroidales bacterium]